LYRGPGQRHVHFAPVNAGTVKCPPKYTPPPSLLLAGFCGKHGTKPGRCDDRKCGSDGKDRCSCATRGGRTWVLWVGGERSCAGRTTTLFCSSFNYIRHVKRDAVDKGSVQAPPISRDSSRPMLNGCFGLISPAELSALSHIRNLTVRPDLRSANAPRMIRMCDIYALLLVQPSERKAFGGSHRRRAAKYLREFLQITPFILYKSANACRDRRNEDL
jgi:hypothetical protein